MKSQKLIFVLSSLYLVLFLAGCASIPKKELLPTYHLNNTTYLPLIALCDARGVSWDYDITTRIVALSRDTHKLNLMVGDRLVLADGVASNLNHPVDIYQGIVVVPGRFKEEIFDAIFKEIPASPATLPALRIKKIVIDSGHGGNDPGAIGRTGTKEKYITLDLAKRLSSLLADDGIQIVMTRSSDKFIPLEQRVEIANNFGAELFISIHANANRVKSLNGFEVYYITPDVDDSKRAANSATYATLDLGRGCFASDSLTLKTILWDMIHTNNRAESIRLASFIDRVIARNLNIRILGVKAANFHVLRGTRMPAVLIEVGFLSNYDEECKLKNSYYRQQIANAIAQGIEGYARDIHLAESIQ